METEADRRPDVACRLDAMDPAQRERYPIVIQKLKMHLKEIRELPYGYAFRFPPEMCVPVAEFVSLERLCCPFVNFVMELEREQGPLWLRMTGPENAKEFLKAEMNLR